jgi:hypothetical protein
MQTKVSNAFAMSASGRAEWKIALADCGIGDMATFVKAVITVVSRPTAECAFDGGRLERQTWEKIFKELDLQRSDFFTEAKWWQWDLLTLWGMLWNLGEDASDRFGLVLPDRLERADLRGAKLKHPSKYMTKLRINSKVLLEIPSGLSGYLILLEQNKDGGINLISPSQLMKNTLLTGEAQRLPQLPVDEDIAEVIEMTDEGTRYLWAGIFAQLPDWGWLVGAKDDILELQVEQLRDLLGYAKHQPPGTQIWRSSYTVMA